MTVLVVLTVVFPLVIFFLVRRGQRLTPEEAAVYYLNAVIGGRTADAYNMLSAGDRAKESLEEYRERRSLGHGLIAEMIARKVKISVSDTVVSGNEASVAVSITIPDFRGMMSEALQGMAGEAFPDRNIDAFVFVCRGITHYLGKFGGAATPMKSETEMLRLVSEDGRWKVCPGR